MGEYCMVMTTFEDDAQADPVITAVLEKRLAACVQTLGINSHYTWENERYRSSEVLVMMKTEKSVYPELESLLLELHPYDTPEIIQVPISNGSSEYLGWISAEVGRR